MTEKYKCCHKPDGCAATYCRFRNVTVVPIGEHMVNVENCPRIRYQMPVPKMRTLAEKMAQIINIEAKVWIVSDNKTIQSVVADALRACGVNPDEEIEEK